MKISFWGGVGTVTGSKYVLTAGSVQILVDCGLFQGLKDLRLKNWAEFPMDPAQLDAVLLTHAHLDHSGYLPLLVKKGFRGPIFSTAETRELARILLLDSAYLQEEEAKFANRHGYSKHHPARPLYEQADAEKTMDQFHDVRSGQGTQWGPFAFDLVPAGHLLGAASVRVEAEGQSVLFSGDLGRESDPLLYPPQIPRGADTLVIESTYGDRHHVNSDAARELSSIVQRVIGRGGTVLIPAFAAGRAQLLLYYIYLLKKRGQIPDVPVYLNSPMANSVNSVYRRYPAAHKLGLDISGILQAARIVSTPEESRTLNTDPTPKIILAASGMATGGRVLHHLKALLPESRNAIVFAGFQAAGTRGEALIHGKKEIKIHGQMWPVRAEVMNLESLSAHADAGGLLDWAKKLSPKPKQIFVTHGEPTASRALAEALRNELPAAEVLIPKSMDEYDL